MTENEKQMKAALEMLRRDNGGWVAECIDKALAACKWDEPSQLDCQLHSASNNERLAKVEQRLAELEERQDRTDRVLRATRVSIANGPEIVKIKRRLEDIEQWQVNHACEPTMTHNGKVEDVKEHPTCMTCKYGHIERAPQCEGCLFEQDSPHWQPKPAEEKKTTFRPDKYYHCPKCGLTTLGKYLRDGNRCLECNSEVDQPKPDESDKIARCPVCKTSMKSELIPTGGVRIYCPKCQGATEPLGKCPNCHQVLYPHIGQPELRKCDSCGRVWDRDGKQVEENVKPAEPKPSEQVDWTQRKIDWHYNFSDSFATFKIQVPMSIMASQMHDFLNGVKRQIAASGRMAEDERVAIDMLSAVGPHIAEPFKGVIASLISRFCDRLREIDGQEGGK